MAKDDFQEDFPQPRAGGRDDFQENWTGQGPADMVKEAKAPEGKPGLLRRGYEFMGGAPGIAATGASIVGGMLAPETGGLSLMLPALASGTTAGIADLLTGGKDPLTTAITTGAGDILGGTAGKFAKPLINKFQLGKYVGGIGRKMGEIFDMPGLKATEQGIYNALHLKQAEQALSKAYRGVQDMIFSRIPPDTEITGPLGQKLKLHFYNHVPEAKELMELEAKAMSAAGPPPPMGPFQPMRPGQMTQAQIGQRTGFGTPGGQGVSPLDAPLRVGDALEYARKLGYEAGRSAKGTGGHDIREINRIVREDLGNWMDSKVPGANLGRDYSAMNHKYAQGSAVLSAFEDTETLFKKTKGGPKLDRVEWEKASENALARFRNFNKAEELDALIRGGRPPGYVGSKIGGHVGIGIPGAGALGVHPRTYLNIGMGSPLPYKDAKISPELIRKILQPTGANIGAQLGE